MNNDTQLQSVQSKIGKVEGQMKENIELVLQRQENLDGLTNKTSSLQQSASQFSQVASRIRENQQLEQYKFFTGILFGVVTFILFVLYWSSPGKLFISLIVVGAAALVVYYFFQKRTQGAMKLADSVLQRAELDPEQGIVSE